MLPVNTRSRALWWSTTLIAVVPFALIYLTSPETHHFLLTEDGLVEWVGALAWWAAAACFLAAMGRGWRYIGKLGKFWYVVLALITFVAGGEELSWGQRVFGYATPEAIAEANLQGEFNLHNLQVFDIRDDRDDNARKSGWRQWITFSKLGALIWSGYLILLPFATTLSPVLNKLAVWLSVPVPPLLVAVSGLLGFASFTVFKLLDRARVDQPMLVNSDLNEYKETLIALLFMLSALYCLDGVGRLKEMRTGANQQ